MKQFIVPLLFWTLILSACGTGISPTTEAAPAPIISSERTVIPLPKLIATIQTPHIDQPPDGEIPTIAPTYEGCAYMWAYQDLPEISSEFQHSIQKLQPEAQANAYAFGEDCVYADGHKTFGAMETDFNVTVQVSDLSNETELGEWIVKTMGVIVNLPNEMIHGPRLGRVSMTFKAKAGNEQKVVNFNVDQYQALPSGLSNAEIYQALQTPQ